MVTFDALASLVPGARLRGSGAVAIEDLAYDSRDAGRGTLFFCIPGARHDGHDFAAAAVRAGAVGLVVERHLPLDVPQLRVPSVRGAMGPIAASFFGDPSRALTLVGVTGTNGKTTSTYMLASVARARGLMPGIVGTVETRIGGASEPVERTTPESVDLQRLLARMRAAGVGEIAMEVSSHGLHYGRVVGTRFACAVFTNLSQDHLDEHGSMEAYFQAKASLFTEAYTTCAVINVDDAYGIRLVEATDLDVVTFALEADADVRARSVDLDSRGSSVRAEVGGRAIEVGVPLGGRYNVANALGVLAVGQALGWDPEVVAAGIEATPGVPGRLERIDAGQDFTVLVDYAHTPDALDNVLRAARELTPRGARLIVVFGCGGDRDPGKRPRMGAVAAGLADRVIITSDNPRSEDPGAIIDAVAAGAREGTAPVALEADRRAAIAEAIAQAGPGDVVVVAGKGHETGQRFADRVVPFDDRVVAREILEGRG